MHAKAAAWVRRETAPGRQNRDQDCRLGERYCRKPTVATEGRGPRGRRARAGPPSRDREGEECGGGGGVRAECPAAALLENDEEGGGHGAEDAVLQRSPVTASAATVFRARP